MATRSKGDGLEPLPSRKGKKWWRARLYWSDPLTGAEREKQETFQADSWGLAVAERERRLEAAKLATPTARAAKLERHRFKDASESWWTKHAPERGTKNTWTCYRRRLDDEFGEWFLDVFEGDGYLHLRRWFADLKPSGTKRARPKKSNELAPVTYNGIRQVAKHIFDHAIDKGWMKGLNPILQVKRKSERSVERLDELGEEPKRSLTEDEAVGHLKDLREHEPEAYPLVVLAYHLGVRFGEVSALRHEDIDFERRIVKVRRGQYKGEKGRTKGKYARTAGLPVDVANLLKEHVARVQAEGYPGADEIVFPRPPSHRKRRHDFWSGSTLHRKIVRSYVRLGLRGDGVLDPVVNTTHTARHTVATLAEEMASASVIMKVLGQTPEVHKKYKHPSEAKVIELGDAIAKRLKARAQGDKK